MKFIETIKNIYRIEELRTRILFTLGLILIYRLGSFVVLPGIDPDSLANLERQSNEGLLGLINMFSGGAFANASVFALGIMPYISSSIVIQLLGMAIPYFQKLQREGESGRKKITQITRILTIFIKFNFLKRQNGFFFIGQLGQHPIVWKSCHSLINL